MQDHAKGCEGRNYTCTCGYDDEVTAALRAERQRCAEIASNEAILSGNGDGEAWIADRIKRKILDLPEVDDPSPRAIAGDADPSLGKVGGSDPSANLMPCPFCGGAPSFESNVTDSVVRCEGCGARVESSIHPGVYTTHEAMKRAEDKTAKTKWNSRSGGLDAKQ